MATNVYFETGDNLDETNFQLVNDAILCATDFIQDGYELSDGSGLVVDVAAGTAVINGYVIVSDAVQNITVANNDTSYLWIDPDGTVTDELTGTRAGSVLIGSAVTSGGSISSITHVRNIATGANVLAVKASDETVNNSSTLQNDADLAFTVAARQIWEVEYILIIEQDHASADFKAVIDIPSGGITSMAIGPDDDGTTGTLATGGAAEATYTHGSSVSGATHQINHSVQTAGVVIIKGVIWIGDTGGTAQLTWAQRTAQSADTKVLTGSYMIARRIFG